MMKGIWQRFQARLTSGVRWLLILLVSAWMVTVIGDMSHLLNLNGWLALTGPAFWHGQVWRLVTYPLLPFG
ncbi:MAG TPA: hypothetical protein VGN88_11405, partial [Phycisphaerae bacterium]